MSAHAPLAGRAREEPALEIAGLLRQHLDAVLRAPMSSEQHAAIRALVRCRTAVFLKRFLQHILPHGFVKIRHYGLLASGNVTTRLERARALLCCRATQHDPQLNEQDSESDESWPELLVAIAAADIALCPSCGAHAVQRGPLPSPRPPGARAPPEVAA